MKSRMANLEAVCKFLANIMLKAFVKSVSDKEQSVVTW